MDKTLLTPPGTAPADPTIPTQPIVADEAYRVFQEEVGRLPGVLRVERWGKDQTGIPAFQVYTEPDDLETEYEVYEVQGQVYDRYPEAYLEVVVLEASESLCPPEPTCPGG